MAEFIDAPEDAKVDTIAHGNKHMYFRYDTATGKCTYLRVDITSPNGIDDFTYKSFANIGYQPGVNGRGISDVSKWNENTPSQVQVIGERTQNNVTGVLTDRIYRYWDVAMQGDGTFLAIVCLW